MQVGADCAVPLRARCAKLSLRGRPCSRSPSWLSSGLVLSFAAIGFIRGPPSPTQLPPEAAPAAAALLLPPSTPGVPGSAAAAGGAGAGADSGSSPLLPRSDLRDAKRGAGAASERKKSSRKGGAASTARRRPTSAIYTPASRSAAAAAALSAADLDDSPRESKRSLGDGDGEAAAAAGDLPSPIAPASAAAPFETPQGKPGAGAGAGAAAVERKADGGAAAASYETFAPPAKPRLNRPVLMQFQPRFAAGALLTVVWSEGQVTSYPLYFDGKVGAGAAGLSATS